jgi:hypothetical protein
MKKLLRMFSFFGAKHQLCMNYPEPQYNIIIEPFAGSAGYSHLYYNRKVILIEKDPIIASVWRYLISATKNDILQLPLLKKDQKISDLNISQEAKWFLGFRVGTASTQPLNTKSPWAKRGHRPLQYWEEESRTDLAKRIEKINHWKIIEGDYSSAPDIEATWFIDPPYQHMGRCYKCSSNDLDFEHLGNWSKTRKGQVMVCENEGADWLPFEFFCEFYGSKKRKQSKEVLWYKSDKKENNLSEFLVQGS